MIKCCDPRSFEAEKDSVLDLRSHIAVFDFLMIIAALIEMMQADCTLAYQFELCAK